MHATLLTGSADGASMFAVGAASGHGGTQHDAHWETLFLFPFTPLARYKRHVQ